MKNRKGFTLVELLIAATILGCLVVFATVAYRQSVAETRWTQAKGKVDLLGAAVNRAIMDYYPNLTFTSYEMRAYDQNGNCPFNRGVFQLSPVDLVYCGYLENLTWSDQYFHYHVCHKQSSTCCDKAPNDPVACACVNTNARLPGDFAGLAYCVYQDGSSGEYKS